ncbi:MAG: SOS response-associated peptidase [Chitinophagaceae bacterium]|nr:SOS response-associated peptidase [Chitinophagaceae bacterium]
MCYYNGQKVTRAEYIRLKALEKAVANYDFLHRDLQVGFDYGFNAVLKRHPDKEDFDIVQMEWGFIPPYLKTREDVTKMRYGYKDASGQFRPPITTLNAVSEEMLNNGKLYRDAALHRRCLVLSTGFYEWRHVHRLNKKTGQPLKTADKYPYYITVKDREYFFMAGIWQPWTDKATGEHVESFAIVTTAANPLMEQIHNTKKRMPAILDEDLAWEWLFGELSEERIKQIGMHQFPASQMQAYTIAKDFREALDPTMEFNYEELSNLEY